MLKARRRFIQAGALALVSAASRAGTAPFRIAYFETYSPLSYRGENGALRGILVDILDEVLSKHMGVTTQHTGTQG